MNNEKKHVSVAHQLLSCLKSKDIKYIFGIVGREAEAISFNEVSGIDFILTRHEFTAGVAADVLSRCTGTPQVAFSTIGPGAANMLAPVALACLDRSPLIAISAQVETDKMYYNHTHQCLDQCSIMRPVTKYCHELTYADNIADVLDAAFEMSLIEPMGPAFISIPIDILKSPAPFMQSITGDTKDLNERRSISMQANTDLNQVAAKVTTEINEAKTPLVIVGNAVIRAKCADLVQKFCEHHQVPLVSSYVAKGILPHAHPLNYGAITSYMNGILNFDAFNEIFNPVDLIITIGYDYVEDLSPTIWNCGKKKILINLSPMLNHTKSAFKPDINMIAPLKHTLHLLLKVAPNTPCNNSPYNIDKYQKAYIKKLTRANTHGAGLNPTHIIQEINNQLGEGILIADIGLFRHYACLFAHANKPNAFITSAGSSSFGFGLPAGIGACFAYPNKKIVVLAGDGGFHSGSQDLETIVRLNLSLVIVVLNNSSNGLIRLYQFRGHQRYYSSAVDFKAVDFVQLANANGCQGFKSTSIREFSAVLKNSFSINGPVLIELPIAYDEFATDEPNAQWKNSDYLG